MYDLDDADYLEYKPKPIYDFVYRSQYVSAGSQGIKTHLSALNSNVFHSTSPIVELGFQKCFKNELFTIGWVGGYDWGHAESLEKYLLPALKKLPFKFKLIMVGVDKSESRRNVTDFCAQIENLQLEMPEGVNWRNEKYIQTQILKFDVGIATLCDTELRRSKSGIKAKQYLNNGVPVICNNLPENNNVVQNCLNGFVCESAEEFAEKLVYLEQLSEQEYLLLSADCKKSASQFNHQNYFKTLFENVKV